MRRWLIGLALALAAETAALACSCIAPGTPEQSRSMAREVVANAVAIVEVQALSGYRYGGGGERVRLGRTLWGKAPAREFRIERRDHASSAACDLLLERGQKKLLILYPATDRRQRGKAYRMQSLCSDYLLSGRFLRVTLEEARRRAR
jgi:hypothetical protein